MAARRALVLAVAATATAIAAAAGVWLVDRSPAPPVVDQAQARAMMPAINAYLAKDALHLGAGYLVQARPRLRPQVFCDARIIEIRPTSPRWRVGMEISCAEFARKGNTLIEGSSGYPGAAEVMTLTQSAGRYRALSLLVGPQFYAPGWVRRNFSPGAAAEINGPNPPEAPDPVKLARRAFGFPPGTPVKNA